MITAIVVTTSQKRMEKLILKNKKRLGRNDNHRDGVYSEKGNMEYTNKTLECMSVEQIIWQHGSSRKERCVTANEAGAY